MAKNTDDKFKGHGWASIDFDGLRVANTAPAASSADLAIAAKFAAEIEWWATREAAGCADAPGAVYECSQAIGDLHCSAEWLRNGRTRRVTALQVVATGEILFAVQTRFGSAFRHGDKWIGGDLLLSTYVKRGYEPVTAWARTPAPDRAALEIGKVAA